MNNFTKKYLIPLVLILVGGFLIRLIEMYTTGNFWIIVVKVLQVFLMFSLGVFFSGKHRRNQTWVKKVIISLILIFLIIWELGYIALPQVEDFKLYLGIYGYIQHLIYVYCGYIFFD